MQAQKEEPSRRFREASSSSSSARCVLAARHRVVNGASSAPRRPERSLVVASEDASWCVDRHIGGGQSLHQSAMRLQKRGCTPPPMVSSCSPLCDHHTHECHVRTSGCRTAPTVVRVLSHRSDRRHTLRLPSGRRDFVHARCNGLLGRPR